MTTLDLQRNRAMVAVEMAAANGVDISKALGK